MISLFREGLESALLPCSLVLLIPGACAALAARQESTPAIVGFLTGSIAFSWLRFSGREEDLARPVVAMAFAASAALLLVPLLRRLNLLALGGGLLAGTAAASLWQPCVGEEFGTLLNDLPDRGPAGFGQMALYTLAVLVPIVALAAIMHVIPKSLMLPVRPAMMVIGGVGLGAFALATAVGLDDELISELVARSI